jgi:hypothetical protein
MENLLVDAVFDGAEPAGIGQAASSNHDFKSLRNRSLYDQGLALPGSRLLPGAEDLDQAQVAGCHL